MENHCENKIQSILLQYFMAICLQEKKFGHLKIAGTGNVW